ncbi:MAG: DUF2924 domain-containing protein [Planctomycetes bacterium]|nr:DUF2924 domain-containing protein [Planctomycetota bacterium]
MLVLYLRIAKERSRGKDGFEMDGERYRSLSAIARKLMNGTSVNGFLFFGLLKQERK